MELFDTLYHWKKMLCERGWATAAEKHEVEEIYKIYHDSENDYTDTPYSDLKNLFNIYVIKAQKSYDNNVIGSTRTIKIKIHTK